MNGDQAACVLPHYDKNEKGERVERERPTLALPGLRLCPGHSAHLEQDVAELPALHTELEQQMAPGSGVGGPKVSGDPETALPFNERAGAHLRNIERQLVFWVRTVTDDRGLVGMSSGPVTVPRLAAFLTRHHEWITAQPWVKEYDTQIRDLRGDARAILSASPRRRVDLGPCDEAVACDVLTHEDLTCEGIIRAVVGTAQDEFEASVACTACGTEHPPRRWRALARRLVGDSATWLTMSQLSQLLRVEVGSLHRWAHEDEWRRTAATPDGHGTRPRRRYHLEDAQASHDRRRGSEKATA